MEESIKISDTDNSFNFEPDELEKWVRTRKAIALLDAFREHLEGRDEPVRIAGVEVDKKVVLQLIAFLIVCTISQIVEVFSGEIIGL